MGIIRSPDLKAFTHVLRHKLNVSLVTPWWIWWASRWDNESTRHRVMVTGWQGDGSSVGGASCQRKSSSMLSAWQAAQEKTRRGNLSPNENSRKERERERVKVHRVPVMFAGTQRWNKILFPERAYLVRPAVESEDTNRPRLGGFTLVMYRIKSSAGIWASSPVENLPLQFIKDEPTHMCKHAKYLAWKQYN